jgi:hypothetical protein
MGRLTQARFAKLGLWGQPWLTPIDHQLLRIGQLPDISHGGDNARLSTPVLRGRIGAGTRWGWRPLVPSILTEHGKAGSSARSHGLIRRARGSSDAVTVLISQHGDNYDSHVRGNASRRAPDGRASSWTMAQTRRVAACQRFLCGSDVVAGAFSLNGRGDSVHAGAGGTLDADLAGFISGIERLCTVHPHGFACHDGRSWWCRLAVRDAIAAFSREWARLTGEARPFLARRALPRWPERRSPKGEARAPTLDVDLGDSAPIIII